MIRRCVEIKIFDATHLLGFNECKCISCDYFSQIFLKIFDVFHDSLQYYNSGVPNELTRPRLYNGQIHKV